MYIPVLKWKLGEKQALAYLDSQTKENIMPLIELQPHNIDADDNPDDVLKNIVSTFGNHLTRYMEGINTFFLDWNYFNIEYFFPEYNYIKDFFLEGLAKSFTPIPVIAFLDMDNFSKSLEAMDKIRDCLKKGISIRISPRDLKKIEPIIGLLQKYNFTQNTTVIIDYTRISETDLDIYSEITSVIYNKLSATITQFILIGTGYPEGYPSQFMNNESYAKFERIEQRLWTILKSDISFLSDSTIHYGDYCCTSPTPLPSDLSNMRPSATIKYTTEDNIHFYKGTQLIRGGYQQYHDLCKLIVNDPAVYKGENYSWGDSKINETTNPSSNTGNPTTWISIATNHHITLTAKQYANQV